MVLNTLFYFTQKKVSINSTLEYRLSVLMPTTGNTTYTTTVIPKPKWKKSMEKIADSRQNVFVLNIDTQRKSLYKVLQPSDNAM